MTRVPIVFAFDNNWIIPASVCIYSLLINAKSTTEYDIYILYPKQSHLDTTYIQQVIKSFPGHNVKYIGIGNDFDKAFQIRGINTLTYYRLLIPEIITGYDKIIYSDVDVIFQEDLEEIYTKTELKDTYLGVVNSLAHLDSDRKRYYEITLGLDSTKIFYAGNIILNIDAIRSAGLKPQFMSMIETRYKFQDMDILNITCSGKVKYLPPSFCVTTYFCELVNNNRAALHSFWPDKEIDNALSAGTIHYNGQKPWKGLCLNFDIWWEYYRKSPIFDEKFYFDFYYSRLNELDALPLIKRLKILARYFVYGRRTNP